MNPEKQQQRQRHDHHVRHGIVSSTNARLRQPSLAASLAIDAVSRARAAPGRSSSRNKGSFEGVSSSPLVVIGIGPGRSGTKSLNELFSSQTSCVRSEHEMIVPRTLEDRKGRGSWGSDRRLEWDPPRQARGTRERTNEEAANWRVSRLLEQRREFSGWVHEKKRMELMDENKKENFQKQRKLGARGWREFNEKRRRSNQRDLATDASNHYGTSRLVDKTDNEDLTIMHVAAVSSSALAYAHEYVALDPSTRIAALTRPIEDVVASFVAKTRGRNHWQHYDEENPIKDKTWDNQFPNMTDEECMAFVTNPATKSKPDKTAAIRAYCDLYKSTTEELARRYPHNVRIFHMSEVLNDKTKQDTMLRWCGFDDPLLDTAIHWNKSR